MFRYSKDGISVLTVLDTRRAKKSGLFPVKVQIVHNRKQKYYTTGKELSEIEWTKLKDTKNHRLAEIRSDIENSFSIIKEQVSILADKGDFCFESLALRLGRCSSGILSVNDAFEIKMKELKNNNQASSYLNYRSALRALESFSGKDIAFAAITVDWLNHCEKFWVSSGKSYSSISFYMRDLKCIINRAQKDGIIKETQYPFGKGKYEIPTGCGRKLALTLPQIKQVVTYTDGTEKTEEYRDLWFFSYLCNGINFMDLLFLQYSNIVNGEICFIRAKTSRAIKHSKEIHAVITPEMQRIIDRWGNVNNGPDTYIFKYAKGTENAFEKLQLVRSTVATCNRRLRKIAKSIGIEKLTTYTARHSFATVLKRSGANTSYISESLGHSNLMITENYLASFEIEERVKNAKLLTNF